MKTEIQLAKEEESKRPSINVELPFYTCGQSGVAEWRGLKGPTYRRIVKTKDIPTYTHEGEENV